MQRGIECIVINNGIVKGEGLNLVGVGMIEEKVLRGITNTKGPLKIYGNLTIVESA